MSECMTDCDLCGGPVEMIGGAGRKRQFRPGVELRIPDDFLIATCRECHETYLTAAEAKALEAALVPEYARHCKRLIDAACARANVTMRQLERAAGVTQTYFSHITAGRKLPSLALTRLLEAFALYPSEIERHLSGINWESAAPPQSRAMFKRLSLDAMQRTSEEGKNDNAYAEPKVGVVKVLRMNPRPIWKNVSQASSPAVPLHPKENVA
jgi:hypothetical protein